MKEEWRSIVGYVGLYEVSNMGQVRSLNRVVLTDNMHPGYDQIVRKFKGKILKYTIKGDTDYPRVTLRNGNGIERHVRIHILVLETFREPRPAGLEACHADDNKSNNTLDNLYWGTRSNNVIDAERNGKRNAVRTANAKRKGLPRHLWNTIQW